MADFPAQNRQRQKRTRFRPARSKCPQSFSVGVVYVFWSCAFLSGTFLVVCVFGRVRFYRMWFGCVCFCRVRFCCVCFCRVRISVCDLVVCKFLSGTFFVLYVFVVVCKRRVKDKRNYEDEKIKKTNTIVGIKKKKIIMKRRRKKNGRKTSYK